MWPRFANTLPPPGTELTVNGTGFGLDDYTAVAGVLFGNPSDGTQSPILSPTSGFVWPDGTMTLTVRLPALLGPNRAVRVVTYPRALPPSPGSVVGISDPIADTGMSPSDADVPPALVDAVGGAGAFFSYNTPVIGSISVSAPYLPGDIAFLFSRAITCDATGCGPYVKLSLVGSNFGPSSSVTGDSVGRVLEFGLISPSRPWRPITAQ